MEKKSESNISQMVGMESQEAIKPSEGAQFAFNDKLPIHYRGV